MRIWLSAGLLGVVLLADPAAACLTEVNPIGEMVTIPVTGSSPGQLLWQKTLITGQWALLDTVLVQTAVPSDADAGKFVFHVFVTDSAGRTNSPFWLYAVPQSLNPQWWQPVLYRLGWNLYGPVTVSVVAVNISSGPQRVYWAVHLVTCP